MFKPFADSNGILWLNGNPIICNCEAKWIKELKVKNSKYCFSISDACNKKGQNAGKKWNKIKTSDLCDASNNSNSTMVTTPPKVLCSRSTRIQRNTDNKGTKNPKQLTTNKIGFGRKTSHKTEKPIGRGKPNNSDSSGKGNDKATRKQVSSTGDQKSTKSAIIRQTRYLNPNYDRESYPSTMGTVSNNFTTQD